ncbi:MAG: coproporphyrinogen dehydrogenase HemZ [Oscillospiraceae bacterium]|nr:coproporphyrinogen dehydrogenase HemZ [Oscillospiraceae bacterium]
MNLYLTGHAFRYAVEQMLLILFPQQRPVYPDGPAAGDSLYSRLTETSASAAVTADLTVDGRTAHEAMTLPADAGDRDREQAVKLTFFRAAVACTGVTPPWGAMTGVRPPKLAVRLMDEGRDRGQTDALLRDLYCVSAPRRRLCLDAAEAHIRARNALGPNELSLYVGIPFCPSRCAYCSFVTHSVEKSLKLVQPFLTALLSEIEAAGEALRRAGKTVRTLYIGGGTPTTLTAAQLDQLLAALEASFDLSGCTERTVEAGRPDTVTEEKLAVMVRRGVDRVSVNPQTMQDAVLAAIGRRHTVADVERAVAMTREAGLPCLNMDLIAGLPGDSEAGFDASLDRLLELRPENITIHTLALKRGSQLTLEQTPLPEASAVAAMLDGADAKLRAAGYVPYYLYRQKFMSGGFENVGWALPGYENLYNICMMEELHTILSVGGGGVTKLVSPGRIRRVCNPKYPYEYIERIDSLRAEKAALELP